MHLAEGGQSMSGGAERRHDVLIPESPGVALPSWHTKTPAISIESLSEDRFLRHLLQSAQVVYSLELPCHMQQAPPKLCQDCA